MYRTINLLIITIILLHYSINSNSQDRWINSYFDGQDAFIKSIFESYDNGYLVSGKYGANNAKYNWLIKTDINGNILWEKVIGNGVSSISFHDFCQDSHGNIYLSGSTKILDPLGDPLVMKLDSCGDKEWCRIFYTENNHDFSSCITLTSDGKIAMVLNYTNPDHLIDRICLAKLSIQGELEWKHCHNSSDSSQRNEDTFDIIQTPDSGFQITGSCYYEDPDLPNHWLVHPYFLKLDSTGNFIWESVLFKETGLEGGIAWHTVLNSESTIYYSSISHAYFELNQQVPSLVNFDLQGNVIGVYNLVDGSKFGILANAEFINDSILAGSAGWGNDEENSRFKAVIFDTLGNLLDSLTIVDDAYTSLIDITYDGKLVYGLNRLLNDQFDVYLTKLNQNLEQDTVYTMPFVYDSLCPYPILSDTIVPDDCGLIVNIDEILPAADPPEADSTSLRHRQLTIVFHPNPAKDEIYLQFTVYNLQFAKENRLEIFDVFGRKMLSQAIPRNQDRLRLDISAFPAGLYIAIVKSGNNAAARGKFVVAR